MLNKIANNLIIILKAKETRNFVLNSVENIAKILSVGDNEAGAKEMIGTVKYIGSIKDLLFWNRVKQWLENTYQSPDMEVKIATKFCEDERKYIEYTKRQLQFIAQVDEDNKVDYFSNLTRAWLMGFIASSLYFKLTYLLRIFTIEELEYLKCNYNQNYFSDINFYVREFILYGLVDCLEITDDGINKYKYSDLAGVFVKAGLSFEEERQMQFHNLELGDLQIENTIAYTRVIEF